MPLAIIVVCPHCGFKDYENELKSAKQVGSGVLTTRCDSCTEPIVITQEHINDVQHECLVALGEA